MKPHVLSLPLALAAAGCADDLRDDHAHDPDPDAAPADVDGAPARITHTADGDATVTRVDATAAADWVYLDLETRAEVAATSPAWDLAFQRFKIMIDGGISGPGDMAVAILPGADFPSLAAAPAGPYVTDAADGDDPDADPDLAFLQADGWYAYDPATHLLSPRDRVYVVRSVERNHYKLAFTSFYDAAGTSGFPTFRWAPVAPPPGT